MLYLKLIFRGILRHKKRGIKFFLLLTFCFMMVIFSLSFRYSFFEGYEELGIDARNAHISILSPDSLWLKDSFTSIQKEDLPLLEIDRDFRDFVDEMEEVEIATPIIEVGGMFYTKDGKLQSGGTITGVRASDFKKIFPGITLIKGSDDFKPKNKNESIPFLRWDVQRSEIIKNIDKFSADDFKVAGEKLEIFKKKVIEDFPEIFIENEVVGAEGTEAFIEAFNLAIAKKDFHLSLPNSYTDETAYDIRYIIEQIQTLPFENQSQLSNWNKILVQALYPDEIYEVPEGVSLNKPMGLFIPDGKKNSNARPSLLPIEFIGYVEGIPEFYGYNFIDLEVLQNYMNLNTEESTSYLIRLKNEKNIEMVMEKIENYIENRGLDYKVVDYKYLGNKTHMPIAIAINYVLLSLMALFVLISIFFVSYSVMISLIRRRKETGTVIALGMSRKENGLVFIGENIVVLTVAWGVASVIMGFLISFLSKVGIVGIAFFPKGLMYLIFKLDYFYQAYLLIVIPAILTIIIPLLKINKTSIVDLLKGEVSKRC